jgi:hypothetical protein
MTLTLDRANKRLTDDRGRLFLPGERVWAEAGPDDPAAGSAEPYRRKPPSPGFNMTVASRSRRRSGWSAPVPPLRSS